MEIITPFLQAAMDAATEVAIIATAPDGTIILFNRGAERLLGYQADEVVGKTTPLRFHLDDEVHRHAAMVNVTYGLAISGFRSFVELADRTDAEKFEWTYIHKNGHHIPVELVVTAIRENNRITGYLGMATDISERKQAAQNLNRERIRLQTLLRTIPDLIWLKDTQGVYISCNTRFEHFFGASEAEIVGKTDYDFVAPELADQFREHDRKAIADDKPSVNEEYVTFGNDGHRELLETIKTPMRDNAGNLIGVLGIARNITDIRQAEANLIVSEQRYRQLFEQNPAPMLIYERANLLLLAVNEAFLRHYGYTEAEALQLRLPDLYPEDEKQLLIGLAAELHGHANVGEWHHLRKDGSLITIVAASHDISYQERIARIAVITDITEQKKMAEQLRQSQKMESVGRLAGGVAHDFNNMLTVIISGVDLARRKMSIDDPARKYLDMIAKAAERSTTITRQLLAFSRKEIVAPRPVNINDLTRESHKLLARLITEDITLSFREASSLWTAFIDPSQVDQILMNLVVNARDAMPDGGSLILATANVQISEDYCRNNLDARPGDFVQLSVSDTGCGMDSETMQHIFEPFFTTKNIGEGTGLGLATVYGIVTQNHGFIDLDSKPGNGTTFRIHFPRLEQTAPPDDQQIDAVPSIAIGTILLVEDEEMLLWTITQLLEHMGYTVLQAATPQLAIDIYQHHQQQIDLILTDVVMPEMNGKEMADRIRAINPAIKILFMSGYSANIVAQRGIIEEGMQYIQKPITATLLREKLAIMLEGAG